MHVITMPCSIKLEHGDACNHYAMLQLDRLVEVDQNGTNVGHKAQNFNQAEYTWHEPEDTNDTNITRKQLDAYVSVGKTKDNLFANFSMVTEVFHTETVIEYANETLVVPSNSFKFSINVSDWPWKDDNKENGLSFGVKLKVKTRHGQNATKLQGNSTGKSLDFGDGMFMDSPSLCIVDGGIFANVSTTTSATVDGQIDIDWEFPHFENQLYYDPIIGDLSDDEGDVFMEVSSDNDDEDDMNGGNSIQISLSIVLYSICLLAALN